MAANVIHRYSPRRRKPFIALDCTVLTESLFESEVFGHERGAFTGSVGVKKGLFEVADGGTLFLDEIGEATLTMQAKLLRVLETGEFRRVGGNETLRATARIVCATNRHLLERAKAGEFREDLYYRIACFCVRIPPLRERMDDLPLLCEAILGNIGRSSGQSYHLTHDAIAYLSRHRFRGNIRELRNILQVTVAHSLHSTGGVITRDGVERCLRMRGEFEAKGASAEDGAPAPAGHGLIDYGSTPKSIAVPLPDPRRPTTKDTEPSATPSDRSHEASASTLQDVEVSHIVELLRRYAGNRKQVAQALGISERTLYRKLKRYGLRELR